MKIYDIFVQKKKYGCLRNREEFLQKVMIGAQVQGQNIVRCHNVHEIIDEKASRSLYFDIDCKEDHLQRMKEHAQYNNFLL